MRADSVQSNSFKDEENKIEDVKKLYTISRQQIPPAESTVGLDVQAVLNRMEKKRMWEFNREEVLEGTRCDVYVLPNLPSNVKFAIKSDLFPAVESEGMYYWQAINGINTFCSEYKQMPKGFEYREDGDAYKYDRIGGKTALYHLGFRINYDASKKEYIMYFPKTEELAKNYNHLREAIKTQYGEEVYLRTSEQCPIISHKGKADDMTFVEAFLRGEIILSDDIERVHDLIHVNVVMTKLCREAIDIRYVRMTEITREDVERRYKAIKNLEEKMSQIGEEEKNLSMKYLPVLKTHLGAYVDEIYAINYQIADRLVVGEELTDYSPIYKDFDLDSLEEIRNSIIYKNKKWQNYICNVHSEVFQNESEWDKQKDEIERVWKIALSC